MHTRCTQTPLSSPPHHPNPPPPPRYRPLAPAPAWRSALPDSPGQRVALSFRFLIFLRTCVPRRRPERVAVATGASLDPLAAGPTRGATRPREVPRPAPPWRRGHIQLPGRGAALNPRRRGLRRAEAPPPRAASDQPYSLPSSPGLGRRKAVEERGPFGERGAKGAVVAVALLLAPLSSGGPGPRTHHAPRGASNPPPRPRAVTRTFHLVRTAWGGPESAPPRRGAGLAHPSAWASRSSLAPRSPSPVLPTAPPQPGAQVPRPPSSLGPTQTDATQARRTHGRPPPRPAVSVR